MVTLNAVESWMTRSGLFGAVSGLSNYHNGFGHLETDTIQVKKSSWCSNDTS
uniref:hypothetical protein n=1 Tax=Ligilactobacillus murinus TaxID=1622 RepID=UPI001CDD207D|nr:hypothetical protein [Ligilactobacillus murinus]